jgi:hypothetical protein
VSIKDHVDWALLQQTLIMYWRIRDLWGPTNLVASMVTELDDTPLYLMDDIGIVFGPSTDNPLRFRVEDDTRVRWAQLESLIVVMNCGHSWCLCDSRVSCY